MSKFGLEGCRGSLWAAFCGIGMMLAGIGAARGLAQDVAAGERGLERPAIQAELTRLAEICDSLGLESQAALSRSWLPAERRDCRTLYLPTEFPRPLPENANQAHWARHFAAARTKYAAHLFAQAEQLAQAGDEAAAFRRLCQVLRENPQHTEAKRILGPLVTAVDQRPKVRRATTPHPDFGWPAGSYSQVETPHFSIVTRADPKPTLALAARMELFLALWRQVFYPLWAPPGQLSERFSGRYRTWEKPPVMEVYLLGDREEYLQILGVAEAGIDVSIGYYAPQIRRSFFYSDEQFEATLFHELTHQLLAEATRIDAQATAGEQGGIWLLEGIALYMESLSEQDGYWILGGIDAPRLQTARYRAVRDGYWVPWKQFTTASKEQWKSDPAISRLYTHSVGLTHLFMDLLPQPQAEEALLKALVAVYQNAPEASELFSLLGDSEAAAQLRYQQMLTLNDADIRLLNDSPRRLTSLVLAGGKLSAETWQSLSRQQHLTWLDVSFSNAQNADLQWLTGLPRLERLSVEGTRVDGGLLAPLQTLKRLTELDLSGCAVDDLSLAQLRGHPTLETLWLTQTRVTDAALPTLATLPRLKFCDVQGALISAQGWQAFLRLHPSISSP